MKVRIANIVSTNPFTYEFIYDGVATNTSL